MDDQLTIIALDATIASSGLFMLVCPYRWEVMGWTMILFIEMTIYVILAIWTRYYALWEIRVAVLCATMLLSSVITFLMKPFTEEIDNWLEVAGRGLVLFIGIGLLIVSPLAPTDEGDLTTPLYNLKTDATTLESIDVKTHIDYYLIDILMVFYFYSFLFYSLRIIGVRYQPR